MGFIYPRNFFFIRMFTQGYESTALMIQMSGHCSKQLLITVLYMSRVVSKQWIQYGSNIIIVTLKKVFACCLLIRIWSEHLWNIEHGTGCKVHLEVIKKSFITSQTTCSLLCFIIWYSVIRHFPSPRHMAYTAVLSTSQEPKRRKKHAHKSHEWLNHYTDWKWISWII